VLRRISSTEITDIDQISVRLSTQDYPLVLIFDADNTLVRQGASPTEFARRVNEVIDLFGEMEMVERVIVLTNGPPRGVDRIIGRGNKPWTSRRRLGISRQSGRVWVIGDQVVTDGVLAWRLRGEFFHLVIDPDDDYPHQARMRRLGQHVAPLIFKRGGFSDPPGRNGK